MATSIAAWTSYLYSSFISGVGTQSGHHPFWCTSPPWAWQLSSPRPRPEATKSLTTSLSSSRVFVLTLQISGSEVEVTGDIWLLLASPVRCADDLEVAVVRAPFRVTDLGQPGPGSGGTCEMSLMNFGLACFFFFFFFLLIKVARWVFFLLPYTHLYSMKRKGLSTFP